MEQQMFKNQKPAKREDMLRDNADSVEQGTYFRRATEEELAQRREGLTDVSIEVAQVETEKREALAEFKERLKPLKQQLGQHLEFLRLKGEEVQGVLFKFVDHDEQQVGFYNSQGELISQRRAYPDEQQTSIHSLTSKSS